MAFSGDVKKTILYFLERHFTDTSDLHTLELGVSSATPLFVSRSKSHICVIDGTNGDGLEASDWLREHGAHTAEVRLIESLHSAPLTQSLDVVLLGEIGRPALLPGIVDALLPALRAGAILILPGLAHHSRHELLCALLEHDDFYGAMTLEDVAFVSCYANADTRRTLLSALDAERYPACEPHAYVVPHPLPCALEFGGYETARPAELVRGFRMSAGRPVTEGRHAMVMVPVEPSTAPRLSVAIVVAPVCRDQRTDASVSVEIGPVKHDTHQFADDTEVTFSAEIDRPEDGKVTIKLWNAGLIEARHLENPPAGSAPYSRPGLELKSIRIGVAGTADAAAPLQRHQGSVVSFAHRGVDYRFFVDNPHDSIQAHHHVGSLYEVEELALLARHVPQGARILDVGANIGNHAAFFEKALRAKRIVVIELQERVIEVLELNVALNSLRAVDLSYLGVGLGAGNEHVRMEIPQAFNVAGAQFTPDARGSYTIVKGDDLLRGEEFDFIKIDVEGMECDVIAGLSGLLTRGKPILFVEVWNENRARFTELTEQLGYEVVDEYRRYDVATNLLLTPKRKRAGAE